MIKSFFDKDIETFFRTDRLPRRFPGELKKQLTMRLRQLNLVQEIEELKTPPSNRLEKLVKDRKGQWSIRINKQWRICFRFEDGNAYDVEIVDYH